MNLLVFAILVILVTLIQFSFKWWPRFFLFRYLPIPFWCYFLAILASFAHLLPHQSPVYDGIRLYLLPLALILILTGTDLGALAHLGRTSLIVMLAGSFGISLGIVLSFSLLHQALPLESWKAAGALAATWTGGSANMLAVQSSLQIPSDLLTPLILTDTLFAYVWMALLVATVGFSKSFDRWIKADASLHISPATQTRRLPKPRETFFLIVLAFTLTWLCIALGNNLPVRGSIFSHTTWTILLATVFALFISATPFRKINPLPTNRFGSWCLLVMLASIGAQVNSSSLANYPIFLAIGVMTLLTHAIVLVVAGKWCKAPLSVLACASQANVGGTVSAPIVAAVFEPQLASLGLLMAILGNLIGTPIGLLIAETCRKLWI